MRRAIWRGALAGAVLIVLISLLSSAVEGWTRVLLFFAVLGAFGVAGFAAGRDVPDRRLTVGMLAGLGAFALWIPIRIVIWAASNDSSGLVTGSDAVLHPTQVLSAAIFACGLGALGGLLGGNRATRSRPEA